MGPRNRFQGMISASLCRARNCKRLRRPGIDSEDSIPPAYVAKRAGTTNRVERPVRIDSWALQIRALAGRYDNPLPPRFLAPITPIDSLKIPEQNIFLLEGVRN
jgi:hypothetical protein